MQVYLYILKASDINDNCFLLPTQFDRRLTANSHNYSSVTGTLNGLD